jgi:hypothetical protein
MLRIAFFSSIAVVLATALGAQTPEERVAREVAAQMEAEGLEPPPVPREAEPRLRAPRGIAIPVTVVVQDGDVPPGEADPVSSVNSPFTNGVGQVGFTGGLTTISGTDNFVWRDGGITWKNSDAVGFVLTGAEGTMGVSDAGDFVYSPSTDGEDSVWTASGLLAVAETQAPGFPPGTISTFHSRPSMAASGRAFWVSGFNESGGTSTEGRMLYTSADGTPGQIQVVLRSDDVIDGFVIDRPSGVDFDYDASEDGSRLIQVLLMDTGSTADDDFVFVDGALVARESAPSGGGDNWDNFDAVSINNRGEYVFSGDTDGATTADEFITYRNVIRLREGGSVGGVVLTSSASVNALAINEARALAHLWTISGGDELLFLSCNAALPSDGILLLTTDDLVDVDGDGLEDATVTDFNASGVIGPGLDLGDSGEIFVEVDLDYGAGELEAVISLELPVCPSLEIFLDGFESGDTSAWDTTVGG